MLLALLQKTSKCCIGLVAKEVLGSTSEPDRRCGLGGMGLDFDLYVFPQWYLHHSRGWSQEPFGSREKLWAAAVHLFEEYSAPSSDKAGLTLMSPLPKSLETMPE